MATIDMKTMRYLNLLDKISRVKTSKCFVHSNTVFFAVNKYEVSRAIGPAAANVRRMQENIGTRIKIIREAEGIEDAKRFIEDIVAPLKIKSAEVQDNCLVLTAGNNQTKANLFGRNKTRFAELKKIVHDQLNLDLKII